MGCNVVIVADDTEVGITILSDPKDTVETLNHSLEGNGMDDG